MCILNITKAKKKMSVNEIRGFIFGNYFKQIGFSKELLLLLNETLEKTDLLLLAEN